MISEAWYDMYMLAKKYYEKNNNLLIPGSYILVDNGKRIKLGKWIIIQRYFKNNGELEEEKIKLLNEIKMVWDLSQSKWMNNYKYAKEYYDKHNNLEIPSCYKIMSFDGKVISLRNWINEQKKFYKAGNLSTEEKELLEKIGFKISKRNILTWDESYLLAKEYYDTYGNLRVSTNYKVFSKNGVPFNLYYWIENQKKSLKENKLDKEKIELLSKININLNYEDDKISPLWFKNYYYAKMFYKKWQRLNIGFDYTVIDERGRTINLGQWITKQRQKYKNNTLSEKQIQLLNDIGMIWNMKDKNIRNNKRWTKNYEFARQYYNTYKNLLIPYDYIVKDENGKEILLGIWIYSQRNKYKQGKLSDECIWLLNNIKMIWDAGYSKWDMYYEELKRFKEIYGDLFVPNNYLFKDKDDTYDLYFWLENQKRLLNARKNSSTYKYYNMLDELGIIWDDITDELLSKYLIDEYNKYINDLNTNDKELFKNKKLVYKDEFGISKADVAFFKKLIANRKGNANK